MQAREVEKDAAKRMNNNIADRLGIKKEIHKLAEKCNETTKDMRILPHVEFWDSFNPYSSMISNRKLLLNAITLQSRDSTCDSFNCTFPVTLGAKEKTVWWMKKVVLMV